MPSYPGKLRQDEFAYRRLVHAERRTDAHLPQRRQHPYVDVFDPIADKLYVDAVQRQFLHNRRRHFRIFRFAGKTIFQRVGGL